MALVQKKAMFTFNENSGIGNVVDFAAMGDYYENRYS
jgi:hypothetical protein